MHKLKNLFAALAIVVGLGAAALAANEIHYDRSIIFRDNVSIKLGSDADVNIRWDGTDLDILAAADDSVAKLGNGTNSFDLWLYGNAAADYVLWDASAGELDFQGAAYVRTRSKVTAKTADYTVTSADYGTILTNRGDAGAIIFTLPAPAAGNSGDWVEFYGIVDEDLTLTTAAGEEICTFNNATADSVGWATTGEQIGSGFRAISDGTSWIVVPLANEAATMTVTDA